MKLLILICALACVYRACAKNIIDKFVGEIMSFNVTDVLNGSGGNKAGDTEWMYVFTYSWTPGFCQTQSNDPGCDAPEDYWKTHFTLHGLWPQYIENGYPQTCTNEAFNPADPESIGMDTMTTYWPNVQANPGDSDYDSFWQHEWSKHGTCSGLDQTAYFQAAIDLIKKVGTPSIVSDNVGKSVATSDIRDAFGGASKAILKCSSKTMVGLSTCYTQSKGMPDQQVDCPPSTKGEDNCGSGSITIPSM